LSDGGRAVVAGELQRAELRILRDVKAVPEGDGLLSLFPSLESQIHCGAAWREETRARSESMSVTHEGRIIRPAAWVLSRENLLTHEGSGLRLTRNQAAVIVVQTASLDRHGRHQGLQFAPRAKPEHMAVWNDDRHVRAFGIAADLPAGHPEVKSAKVPQGNDLALAKVIDKPIEKRI
jgi:hypothetical protein